MIALPLWIDDNLFVRGLVKAAQAVMGGSSALWLGPEQNSRWITSVLYSKMKCSATLQESALYVRIMVQLTNSNQGCY